MKLFICPNLYTEEQIIQARDCIQSLEQAGNVCSLSEEDAATAFPDGSHHGFEPSLCDLVVSVGGDGRVLRASHIGITYGKPVIGVNSGRKGYLCALDISEIHKFNEIVAMGKVTEKTLLELDIDGREYLALNDFYVTKMNFGKTVDLTVQVRDETLKIRADGIIVATPTGSTAYNRSAGGPVLDEKSAAVVLTPVCPNDDLTYPVVYGDDCSFRIRERNDSAMIFADGELIGNPKSDIVVRKSKRTLSLFSGKQKKY